MAASGGLSVIVRARDEERNLERCLTLIGAQDEAAEVIFVDCGSSDGSVTLARDHGATVLCAPAARFSFGAALNLGAARAQNEILVALSAHAYPPDSGWLGRLTAALADPRVACASGDRYGPDGERLRQPVGQDAALARRRPEWGYSNGAGAFRAELWRARGFRTDLLGCEDKEWALHWLERGYTCLIDPALAVAHDHTHDSLRSIFGRARREARGYGAFLDRGPYGPRELARDWWCDLRWYDSPVKGRLSHRRAARLLGDYAGRRKPT